MKEKQTGSKALAEAARTYLEAHSAEKFSLDEMAGALYVNGNYLTRAFRQHTGMTPLAYHHQLRCERAKELLTHSDLTVSKVGEAVGYVSSSHFSHIFRKLEGCTPSEFQNHHRPDPGERTEG